MTLSRTVVGPLLTAALIFMVATATAQTPQGTAPEGWTRVDPAPGRVAALRHPASLAFIEAARLDVSTQDLDSARSEFEARLRDTGFIAEGLSEAVAIAGHQGLKYRYTCEVEGFVFTLLLVEVHVGDHLWQISALFRPGGDHSAEAIDKELVAFSGSLLSGTPPP